MWRIIFLKYYIYIYWAIIFINIYICVFQSPYKYVVVVFITAIILKLPRFFQFKLIETVEGGTDYWTTSIMEDPVYIRFSSYWDDLFTTGFLPLAILVFFNLRIYLKVIFTGLDISKYVISPLFENWACNKCNIVFCLFR